MRNCFRRVCRLSLVYGSKFALYSARSRSWVIQDSFQKHSHVSVGPCCNICHLSVKWEVTMNFFHSSTGIYALGRFDRGTKTTVQVLCTYGSICALHSTRVSFLERQTCSSKYALYSARLQPWVMRNSFQKHSHAIFGSWLSDTTGPTVTFAISVSSEKWQWTSFTAQLEYALGRFGCQTQLAQRKHMPSQCQVSSEKRQWVFFTSPKISQYHRIIQYSPQYSPQSDFHVFD